MNSENVMIKNRTNFGMEVIFEFLAGNVDTIDGETVAVIVEKGKYYDTVIVKNK